MHNMLALVVTVHIIVAILIIAVVLLQQGKGANMGASFGAGSSQTVFGSRGAAPFLFKFTAFLVAVFFVTSVGLSYIGKHAAVDAKVASSQGVSQADYQQQQAKQQALLAGAAAHSQSSKPVGVDTSTLLAPKVPTHNTSVAKEDSKKGSEPATKTTKEAQ